MTDWRSDPATEAQISKLRELNVPVRGTLSKGEASDLISAHMEPSDEELEILALFKIRGRNTLSQLDARRKIRDLLADPGNKARWEKHRAKKEREADDPIAELIDSLGDLISDEAGDYGCRKPSKALLKKTFRALLDDGHSIEAIDAMADDIGSILRKAAELDPTIVKQRASLEARPAAPHPIAAKKPHVSPIWLGIGIVLIVLIILALMG